MFCPQSSWENMASRHKQHQGCIWNIKSEWNVGMKFCILNFARQYGHSRLRSAKYTDTTSQNRSVLTSLFIQAVKCKDDNRNIQVTYSCLPRRRRVWKQSRRLPLGLTEHALHMFVHIWTEVSKFCKSIWEILIDLKWAKHKRVCKKAYSIKQPVRNWLQKSHTEPYVIQ